MSDTHAHGHAGGSGHGTRRGYLIGFAASALLTAIPFYLVLTGVLADVQSTAIAVIVLAFVQIVVHTVCFLHVNVRSEGGWTLLATIFTVVLVAIVITGSMWIMYHLNSNMMPMGADGMSEMP